MSIENWKVDLAPLLHGFKTEPRYATYDREKKKTFTDQFGNEFYYSYGKKALLKLLNQPSLGTVESDEIDKGHHEFTLYQHADSYFILYETRIDMNGWCGHFSSFVVIPDLGELTKFVESMRREEW